jgi:hypothetical protein
MKYKGKYHGRLITIEQAKEMIKDGYYAIDPHCHSSYSYDVPDVIQTSAESVIKAQKIKGLKHILTDHDTLNGHNYLKKKGHDIVPAVELTFRPKIIRKVQFDRPPHMLHINIFGLNDNDLIILKEIARKGDLDELVKYCKNRDLDWMYNHPLYHEKYEKLNWRIIPGLAKNYFDVIELNSQFSKGLNDINQRIAEKLGKGIVASSDSHTGNPGTGFVLAEGKNFKDFWENVKQGKMYVVRKDMGTFDVVRESSLMIKHAFNSNPRPRIEKKFTPDTGFGPFDNIAKSVTTGRLRNQLVLKKVIQMLLQSLRYTAGPFLAWQLHVTKDEEKAERIRTRIHRLTDKMRDIKENIKYKGRKIKRNIKNKSSKFKDNIKDKSNNLKQNLHSIKNKGRKIKNKIRTKYRA